MARRRKPANRPNGRGTLYIERSYPQVGKLRLASGTNDSQAYNDVIAMLDNLARGVPPRYDILEAIRDRKLKPMYALSLWRQGQLEHLPTAAMLPLLAPKWEAWWAKRRVSETYREQANGTLQALLRQGTEPRIGDLPRLLCSFRDECEQADKNVRFNRSKVHVQSFVKGTAGKRSQLYIEVSDVEALPEGQALRRPQKPEALQRILQCLPEPHRRIAWELAVTGMRPKEYFDRDAWTQWSDPAYIEVRRSKTKAGVRSIPLWVGPLVGPTRSRVAFEDMWRRRVWTLDIYDLRRSFAVWMEDAGIPRSRRRLYLGHSAGDVTDLYETRELQQWLAEDAERLRTYAPEVWRWINGTTEQDGDGNGQSGDGRAAPAYADSARDRRKVGGAGAIVAWEPQTITQTQEG